MESGEKLKDGTCSSEYSDTNAGTLCYGVIYGVIFPAEGYESCFHRYFVDPSSVSIESNHCLGIVQVYKTPRPFIVHFQVDFSSGV